MKNFENVFSLKNKVAYLTGGLGLIGIQIAKSLSDFGAKTIVLDIHDTKTAKKIIHKSFKKDSNIFYDRFDISNLSLLDKKMNTLFVKYGDPNIWINNAYPRTDDWGQKIEKLKLSSWKKNIDMHLNSYSWISRKVCLKMKDMGGGSLINFGSIYGLLGNDFSIYEDSKIFPPMEYSAIKGGIINLSKYLSSYFGKYNVRVNTICPGGIFNDQDDSFVVRNSKKTPLGRLANPEEIPPAVIFLSSDASSYVTGSNIIIDGGWTAI